MMETMSAIRPPTHGNASAVAVEPILVTQNLPPDVERIMQENRTRKLSAQSTAGDVAAARPWIMEL